MSVLIATGVLAAYLASLVLMAIGGQEVFFEAAAMLVTFVLFGQWMEMKSRRGTTDALRALFDLVPPMATVVRDGRESEVPTADVIVGDTVMLRPGEKVPVDGEILTGQTSIDEALVTGESLPVEKGPGDAVIGGSINRSGSVTFLATKVGSETALAQIVALVQKAQSSKAPGQRLADQAAQYLVVLAVGSGIVTFLAWTLFGHVGFVLALTFAISAVVIACPDALGLTSDGGWPWVAEADAALGLTAALAAVLPEHRRRRGRHTRLELLRQRIYQIAAGYADQNDADTLRRDPLLKLVCGRLPESDPDLASQPTFSRLENGCSARDCYRLAEALGEVYLRERERDGVPTRIVLDLDSTADPTHGAQEGSAYHGYYRQHLYHPLLVFDGDTGHVITAILRPGTAHAGHGALAILRRLVRRLRARWPGVAIAVRADAGFAKPEIYSYCDQERIDFTIGLVTNARLEALAAPLVASARAASATADGAKVRLLDETVYQAGSWPHARRVVIKAEILAKGANTRFVVTTRPDPPAALYAWYTDRGETENGIKDLKLGCFADRLSCHRFLANQVRLLLHAAAYSLLDTLRRWLVATGTARMQLDTLRLRLLKIGGRVRQLATHVPLRLASNHPGEPLWHHLATREGRL